MDWNGKWDLDNLVSFGPKVTYVPKKLGFGDLFLMDGEIDTTSPFNLSSGSNGHHASPESSTRDAIQNPSFKLMTSKDSPRNSMTKSVRNDAEITEVVGKEPLIGLKLGKRTYFENTVPVGNAKASSSSTKLSTSNRSRSTYRNSPIPRCIVEGCAIDLSTAKEYHQKHKVCDTHSKSSKVIVGGAERRFCQQCSRFHSLSEFDDKKRSCRRRLFDHNARRRKPQPETMLLNSAGPSSPFYEGREQIGFFLTNGSDFNTRNYATTKFTMTRDHSIRCEGDGGIADPTHAPVIKLSGNDAMHIPSGTGLFSSKISAPVFLDSGCKESFITSPPPHMEAATEYGRALSLLSRNNSNNSWGSCAIPLPIHCQGLILPPTTEPPVPTIYGLGLGVAEEALPDFLLTGHHHSSAQNTPRESQDQASRSQVLRGPNEPERGFCQNGPQMTDKTSSQFGFFY